MVWAIKYSFKVKVHWKTIGLKKLLFEIVSVRTEWSEIFREDTTPPSSSGAISQIRGLTAKSRYHIIHLPWLCIFQGHEPFLCPKLLTFYSLLYFSLNLLNIASLKFHLNSTLPPKPIIRLCLTFLRLNFVSPLKDQELSSDFVPDLRHLVVF